jgi:hypothetical protein
MTATVEDERPGPAARSVNGAYAVWLLGFSTSRFRQSGLIPKTLARLRQWTRSRS